MTTICCAAPASTPRLGPQRFAGGKRYPTLRDLFDLEERDAMRRVLSRRQQAVRRSEQMLFAFDVVQTEAEDEVDALPRSRAA